MTKKITVLAFLVGAALPSAAQAQSWGDFSAAFPLFPCQDGWMGCIVEGQPVSPDMQPDGTGAPVPAQMRVGWFDLQPTRSFSPFVSLSRYTGELASAAVADAEPVEPEEPAPPPEPPPPPEPSAEEVAAQQQARAAAQEASKREAERRAAEQAAREAAQEQEAQRRAAEEAERRQRELEAQAKAAADAAEAERLRKEAEEEARRAKEAEEARKRAEEEARKREEERIAKQKAEEEARRKAEEEAAELARLQAEEEARRKAAEEEAARKKAEEEAARQKAEEEAAVADAADAGAADVSAGDATCEVDGLVRLEPMAMMGKLSLAQIKACEGTLQSAAKMTDKEKVSRVLMVNAFAKGDKAGWEQLIKRHLDEIDQSDPEICYKYALHLSKGGAGRATGVIRWANVALENRTVWTGDTYTARVYALYKLRAAAAQSLWQKAENDHATAPSEATKKKAEDYRNQTKVLAREWYEYAKAAGKDTTKALELCMAAAGTADYCEGG